MGEPRIELVELTSDNLREILSQMPEERAIDMMQELANAHGLAIATAPIPDGADKREFAQAFMAKVEEVTGVKPEPNPLMNRAVEYLDKMLRQKAEIEKANIQHCEHNSKGALALQIIGVGISQDESVETQPESFRNLFDSACNTLRDILAGV